MRTALHAILLSLCLLLPAAAPAGEDAGPESFLPAVSCADGWVLDGKVALFDKESLFDRINGESELYFPYGFTTLAYARYAAVQDPRLAIDADVYAMGSPLDAFGIFSNYRRKDSSEVPLGAGGIASSSQALFHQDRYFVRLQATGAASLDQAQLTACARSIAKNLPRDAGRPKELAVLDLPGVQLKTLRYIARGVLGYDFLGRGMIADASLEGDGGQVFFIPGDRAEAAQASFDRYRDYLKRSGSVVNVERRPDGMSLTAVDPLYGSVLLQQTGRGLVGAVKFADPRVRSRIVEQIRKHLETVY